MSETKPCPHCGGTGQIPVSQLMMLAAAAWDAIDAARAEADADE